VLALVARAEAPALDERRELGVSPLVGQADPRPGGRRERHALEEHALVVLERELAGEQVVLGPERRLHLAHARLDLRVAQRARHRHAVVAVLHEVQVADAVDVDRRHRLPAPARGGDPLPAPAQLRGRRPEVAVEFV